MTFFTRKECDERRMAVDVLRLDRGESEKNLNIQKNVPDR